MHGEIVRKAAPESAPRSMYSAMVTRYTTTAIAGKDSKWFEGNNFQYKQKVEEEKFVIRHKKDAEMAEAEANNNNWNAMFEFYVENSMFDS